MKKKPIGLIVGLTGGACIVVFMTVLYKSGVDVYLGPLARLGYLFMFGFAVAACLIQKKAQGGSLEFMAAVRVAFTVFVIVLAMQTLFSWLLVNYLDRPFKEVLNKAVQEKMIAAYREFGMPEDKINEQVATEKGKDPYTLGSMLTGLAFVYIVFFIISLVIAAIVKKKKGEPG
jgi:hypothetical protein